MLGLQKHSIKISPVYWYSMGFWGVILPPLTGVAAAEALRLFISSAISALRSLAALGSKLKVTEPSANVSRSCESDIDCYQRDFVLNGTCMRKLHTDRRTPIVEQTLVRCRRNRSPNHQVLHIKSRTACISCT